MMYQYCISINYNYVMQSVELKQLLEQAQKIGQQLTRIKQDIENDANHTHHPQACASEYIERAIKLRLAFRGLAQGIEMNRNIVQTQKERIQKRKIFLEGLHYYKTTLMDKIKECEIDVINIDEYTDKKIEIDDWNERFPEKQQEVVLELEQKKNMQKNYEKLVADKLRKEAEIKEKKQLYDRVLPTQAKKILSQVQQTSKYFGVQEYDQIEEISNHGISIIYDKINPLRSHKVVELKYTKDQYQELEIVICKNDYKYYRQAIVNKINIVQTDIKLTFACIAPHFNRLVIGLDRREDFTNQEVFQRLINNQQIKPIFASPQNEMERNINAKYVRLEWIENLLIPGIITPQGLFEAIRQRIFCLKMTNYIVQNMKKLLFFFPLQTQNENPLQSNFKKFISGSLQKINFETFSKIAHHPDWLQKYILKFERRQNEMLMEGEEQNSRSNFLSILSTFKLDQALNPNLNSYYKGNLTLHQNVLQFVLIIPFSYPKRPSMINIIEWRKKKEEDKRTINIDLPCKFQANIDSKILTDRALSIQRAVNREISEFFKGQEANNPFRILIQINRLLTLLAELNQRKN